MPRIRRTALLLLCSLWLPPLAEATAIAHLPGHSLAPPVPGGPDLDLRVGLPSESLSGEQTPYGYMMFGPGSAPVASATHDTAPAFARWESPLHLSWGGNTRTRYTASLAGSYEVPHSTTAPSLEEYLESDRFRAWVHSGVEWRHRSAARFALGARWSPANLGGFDSAAPFQAAATLLLPW